MDELTRWKQERRLFLIWVTILSLIFYLGLPFSLAVIPKVMNTAIFGSLSFAWLYAFLQVIMTWIIGWIYWIKAKQLDQIVAEIKLEDTE